jgi:hypothetical protein
MGTINGSLLSVLQNTTTKYYGDELRMDGDQI